MDELTPTAAETEAVRKAYDAINRNDIAGFAALLDPDIERVEPPGFPLAGTYHGLEAVKAHVSQGRSTWAEGACELDRMLVAGDKVVAFIHVRVRLKDHTDWIDGRVTDVFTFRNGRAIQFYSFADERQALEWAGVDASKAN